MAATLLTRRLLADTETPVTAFHKLTGDRPFSFLLESVEGGETLGRYSVIGYAPDLIWHCQGGQVSINRNALHDQADFENLDGDPLELLRALIAECQIADIDTALPPMSAGLFGYLGYAMMRYMEPKLKHLRSRADQPDALLVRPTVMAIFDNVTQTILLVAPVWQNADAALAKKRLHDAVTALGRQERLQPLRIADNVRPIAVTSNIEKQNYLNSVARAKDYILAGDIFQVVLGQRFSIPFAAPPLNLYRHLRRINPSPFLVYMNWGDFHIIASSPEILVRVRDKQISLRPIAGTRPRGTSPEQDKKLAAELLADPKELAEHLMLLDLGRNDVGRAAAPGSVKVTEKMIIEHYSHVMHIVSNVTGTLSNDHDALDAVCAGFPAGTVSGAPKIRAIEIIDELEVDSRGVYGGCIGYFSASGDVDNCIALRTAIIKDNILEIQAGAGIVADSDPESEYQETISKSRALLRAAEETMASLGNFPGIDVG